MMGLIVPGSSDTPNINEYSLALVSIDVGIYDFFGYL